MDKLFVAHLNGMLFRYDDFCMYSLISSNLISAFFKIGHNSLYFQICGISISTLCSEILFFYNSKCNILRMPFRVSC
jgi:hypothetical protein